ncbi:MAG: diaminopimelate epimerase, partial [Desulfurobacterium sp.]
MEKLPFSKLQGTGNDFVIIDNRKDTFKRFCFPLKEEEAIRRICSRRTGVGADGLILVEKSDVAHFRWRFFNADGSVAEMCGNGARCAARFAYMHGIAPARMRFETMAGIIEAMVSDINVSIKMTAPRDFNLHR